LWVTVRGASMRLGAGWVLWIVGTLAVAEPLGATVGQAGVVVSILTLGWLLARRLPDPVACARRYHVDDAEVVVMGPGRRVRRVAWTACRGYAATHRGIRLDAPGGAVMLPLPAGYEAAVWRTVLMRLVPGRADALWRGHEHGGEQLAPVLQPEPAALAAWAWLPAATAVLAAPGASVAALAIGVAAGQCVLARIRSTWRSVVLQPSGVVAPGSGRRVFVAWDEMRATLGSCGLELQGPQGVAVVSPEVPDFMAVAAVIRLHADLGYGPADHVSFRLTVEDGALAVVGEVEGP